MANITPVPYVLLAGVEVPTSLTQGDVVVLDGLNIKWGRTHGLDDVSPASLSMRLLDRTGVWMRKLTWTVGSEVIVGVRFTDSQGIARDFKNFRGRVVNSEMVARDVSTATGTDFGYMISINATDKLAELGNRFFSQIHWPQDYWENRRPLIAAQLGGTVTGIGGVYTAGQVLYAEKHEDSSISVLELIKEHFAATAEFINYDPDTNFVGSTSRVQYDGTTWAGLRFAEMDDGSGKYGLESDIEATAYIKHPRHFYNIDASYLTPLSGMTRGIESNITEVRYEYATNVSGSSKATQVITAGLPPEGLFGRRTFGVKTLNQGPYVNDFATNYRKLVSDHQVWMPPEMEWDTRIPNKGFQNYVHVNNMIGGKVTEEPLFISRSRYNDFPGARMPAIYKVIGSTMTYAKNDAGVMGWVVQPSYSPVIFPYGYSSLTWKTINPSATPVLTYNDLHENMTYIDSALTGQGV